MSIIGGQQALTLRLCVRLRGTRVTECTWSLQSAKLTLSSCLSFHLLLPVVNPLLGPAQDHIAQSDTTCKSVHAIWLSRARRECLHLKYASFSSLTFQKLWTWTDMAIKQKKNVPVCHVHNNRIWPWEIPRYAKRDLNKKQKAEQTEDLWDHSVGYLSGMWSWGFQITGLGVFLSHIWFDQTCLSSATPLHDADGEFFGEVNPQNVKPPLLSDVYNNVREELWTPGYYFPFCSSVSSPCTGRISHTDIFDSDAPQYQLTQFPQNLHTLQHQWQLEKKTLKTTDSFQVCKASNDSPRTFCAITL